MIYPTVVRNLVIGAGLPKICVPLTAGDEEELEQQLKNLKTLQEQADLVELRVDYFPEQVLLREESIARILQKTRAAIGDKPLLFTCRTRQEGGEAGLTPETYLQLNLMAADTGLADLVDVEYYTAAGLAADHFADLHRRGVRVVASNHDFEKTPGLDEMTGTLRAMQTAGADITKLAVMPAGREDVLRLMLACVQMLEMYADRPFIAMAMGETGMISRASCAFTGSAVTFASAGRASAPGQIGCEKIRRLLEDIQSICPENRTERFCG